MARVKTTQWTGLALLIAGGAGLVASGAGWLPGAPPAVWAWIVALGLGYPVAMRWAGSRRASVKEARLNRLARANARKRGRRALRKADRLARRVKSFEDRAEKFMEMGAWAQAISKTVNDMAGDVLALKGVAGPLMQQAKSAQQQEALRDIQED